MEDGQNLNRRDFLRLSAIAAASAMVAACGGQTNQPAAGTAGPGGAASTSATSAAGTATSAAGGAGPGAAATGVAAVGKAAALPAPGHYQEAPMLAELVKAGKLPAVEQRLPKNPYVVPHKWLKTGKYGGMMQQVSSGGWGLGHFMQESMYGFAPMRLLKDGLEIGPGLAESWDINADASQWTLHLRKGLKWSDGQPFTTADFLYWWEDLVVNEEHPETAPLAARSAKGTSMTPTVPDDVTIIMKFDAPAPAVADRLAGGVGWNTWFQPKHYLSQFHPKYNKNVKSTQQKSWTELHEQKRDIAQNPECPTMNGWKVKLFKEDQQALWERNPYYWCVDKEGNQLPFMDGVNVTGVTDLQVLKLQILQGRANYVHGAFIPLTLADVQAIKQAQSKHNLDVLLWDSGSGTGSMCFFNYDYAEPKMRKLIRDPKFRQALSYAYNREQARKIIYFNQGELTTGTLSPKGLNVNVNEDAKKLYVQWRDSYVKYDPEKAKAMLDELGCKVGAGGKRTMPDGSPLAIRLDFHGDTSPDHIQKNNLLKKDWEAIGITTNLNPVPPAAWDDQWKTGQLMTRTDWEVGDNTPMVYPGWVVPVAVEHWAPLHAQYFLLRGTPKEKQELDVDPYKRKPPRTAAEPGSTIDRLWKLFDQASVEPDVMKRIKLEWEIMKIHITDGPFLMGEVANYPQLVLVHKDMRNVPKREDLAQHGWVNTWIHPTPAVYDPEAYYWENPEAHKA